MDEATCTIVQERFLRGRQTLTIEGNKLRVEHRQGLSLYECRFHLRGLLPDPVRIQRVPIVNLVAFTLAGVLGLILILAAIGVFGETIAQGEGMIWFVMVGAVLVIGGILEWIPSVRQGTNIVIFQGPAGSLVLWRNLPNKDKFDAFLAVLTARIRNAQSDEETLLRQLRKADIINDWQYDQATELLRQENNRPGW